MYLKILAELDWPPVYMVSHEQFEHIEGKSIKGNYGISGCKQPVIAIVGGLRGRVKANTIYHEIGHLLFPHRPHWWIDLFGEVMARGGGRGHWAKKYNKTPDDMPPRAHLLKLARRASRRMKARL